MNTIKYLYNNKVLALVALAGIALAGYLLVTNYHITIMNNQDYINMLNTCSLMCAANGGYKFMRWELLPSMLYRFKTETRDERVWSQDVNIETLELINVRFASLDGVLLFIEAMRGRIVSSLCIDNCVMTKNRFAILRASSKWLGATIQFLYAQSNLRYSCGMPLEIACRNSAL